MSSPALRIFIDSGSGVSDISLGSGVLTIEEQVPGGVDTLNIVIASHPTLGDVISQINGSPLSISGAVVQPFESSTDSGELLDVASTIVQSGSFHDLLIDEDTAPILEKIAVKLKERLESVVSGVETPRNTIRVVRPSRLHWNQFTPEHMLVLLAQTDDSWNEERPHDSAEREQTFDIIAFIVPPDSSTQAVDEIANTLRADILQRILQDAQDATILDGLAIDAWIPNVSYFPHNEGEFFGIEITLIVQYRTQLDDERNQ